MNTIRKHQPPNPPKPPGKAHKPAKAPEPAEPQDALLPSIPKSVDWDAIQNLIEKELGKYLKKVKHLDVTTFTRK